MKKPAKKVSKVVKYTESEIEHLKSQSETDLEKVDALTDNKIDYSDIPELSTDDWANAKVIDHAKKAISLRVDMDVLDWYKHQGGRYQKLMNIVLRKYMNSQRHHRK